MHGKNIALVAFTAALLLSPACDEDALQGSCAKRATPDSDIICTDGRASSVAGLTATRQATCRDGQWSSQLCPRAGRLGGCLTGFGLAPDGGWAQVLFWYYPSEMVQTEADVMDRCINGETFIAADGGFPAAPM
jgi:hypothetical protein